MRKTIISLALTALFSALCVFADAQQAKKVQVIGYLSPLDAATDSARAEGVRLAAMWMSSH